MSMQARIAELKAQLLRLSEARAQKLGLNKGKPESTPPAGAQPDRKGPPDPDESLYLYFVYKLEKAKTDAGVAAAVAECEIRLRKRLNGQESRAVAGSVYTAALNLQKDNEQRVAEEYVGLAPAEVAAIETEVYGYCPTAHVRKIRLLKRRNPETGEPMGSEVADAVYAHRLRAEGHSIGSIAMRMGKPKSTVQGWLAKKAA